MMTVTFKCDVCGREYPYKFPTAERNKKTHRDPARISIVKTINGKDYCRQCLKKQMEK